MKNKRGRKPKAKDVEGAALPEAAGGPDQPRLPKDAMAEKEPEEHEKEGWMRTLMDADDIKADEKKMKHVTSHAEKKVGKIKSIADLKLAYEARPWAQKTKV